MSDTLINSEILGVWRRIRDLIDLSKITATDKMNQKEQLRREMDNPIQKNPKFPTNMDTLINNNFPEAFIENPDIRKEILKDRIYETKIKGITRYRVKGGTPSYSVGGRTIKGGQLLGGKTMDDAYVDLEQKTRGNFNVIPKNKKGFESGMEL